MAIKPYCDICGRELTEFGAILLGPPDKQSLTKKFHLCTDCYARIEKTVKSIPDLTNKTSNSS